MPRPRKSINQINVVPYIDVMLVLLIIFMVTAPLINPGTIELPQVKSQLPSDVLPPIEVSVRADGSLWMRDLANASEKPRRLSRQDVIAYVKAIPRNADKKPKAVVIAGDRAARYQDVIALVDDLKLAGVDKVGLLAQPAQSSK
jgi:biopolymer transport protein TolR